MDTSEKITVQSTEISVLIGNESDYTCLTDVVHLGDKERTDYVIQNQLRTRSAIEYLGAQEQLHNPSFNPTEFDGFRNSTGLNSFTLTVKQ